VSHFSHKSLDFRRFVEGFIAFLNFTANDVLSNIILLSKSESSTDGVCSLGTESSWSFSISKAGNFSGALNENLERKNGKIRTTDAASNRLSLALTRSSGSVKSYSCKKKVRDVLK
jgi:hypothetical protein